MVTEFRSQVLCSTWEKRWFDKKEGWKGNSRSRVKETRGSNPLNLILVEKGVETRDIR